MRRRPKTLDEDEEEQKGRDDDNDDGEEEKKRADVDTILCGDEGHTQPKRQAGRVRRIDRDSPLVNQ